MIIYTLYDMLTKFEVGSAFFVQIVQLCGARTAEKYRENFKEEEIYG